MDRDRSEGRAIVGKPGKLDGNDEISAESPLGRRLGDVGIAREDNEGTAREDTSRLGMGLREGGGSSVGNSQLDALWAVNFGSEARTVGGMLMLSDGTLTGGIVIDIEDNETAGRLRETDGTERDGRPKDAVGRPVKRLEGKSVIRGKSEGLNEGRLKLGVLRARTEGRSKLETLIDNEGNEIEGASSDKLGTLKDIKGGASDGRPLPEGWLDDSGAGVEKEILGKLMEGNAEVKKETSGKLMEDIAGVEKKTSDKVIEGSAEVEKEISGKLIEVSAIVGGEFAGVLAEGNASVEIDTSDRLSDGAPVGNGKEIPEDRLKDGMVALENMREGSSVRSE
ncbi:hypothetical protein SLS57_000827 [Botryosphaeria dothidea]